MAAQEMSGAGPAWSESMGNSMVKRTNARLTLALGFCCMDPAYQRLDA